MTFRSTVISRAEKTQEFVAVRDPDGQILLDLVRDMLAVLRRDDAALKECREAIDLLDVRLADQYADHSGPFFVTAARELTEEAMK